MTGAIWRRPEAGRALLAGLFAAAFLINGGIGLWVNLATAHPSIHGLSAVVFLFGLIALAAAVSQFLRLRRHELVKSA